MLNNIKISQTTEEIVLNINVVADVEEIYEELENKIIKYKKQTQFHVTTKVYI